jgi:hypothetical protein
MELLVRLSGDQFRLIPESNFKTDRSDVGYTVHILREFVGGIFNNLPLSSKALPPESYLFLNNIVEA